VKLEIEDQKVRMSKLLDSVQHLMGISSPDELALNRLFEIFTLYYELVSESAHINFTTLFSRIAFTGIQYRMEGRLLYLNHYFRRKCEAESINEYELGDLYRLGCYLIKENTRVINGIDLNVEIEAPDFELFYTKGQNSGSFKRHMRAVIVGLQEESGSGIQLRCVTEEEPERVYNLDFEGLEFSRQIQKFHQHLGFPLNVSLIDVTISQEQLRASGFVLEPDLLIGVTSISECFQSEGHLAMSYLGRKLFPTDSSIHLLMGNVVNYVLDELVHDPDRSFESLLPFVFRIAPMQFAKMDNDAVRQFISKLEVHYNNLKRLLGTKIADTGITADKAYLEPSFYAPAYGIQGRLDLYHHDETAGQSDIIELKSGRLFKANGYGLNENHYVQTMLYDLLVESVHEGRVKSRNYILYSGLNDKNLRYAPRIRSKQLAAMEVRNDIVFIEKLMANGSFELCVRLLNYLDPAKIPEGFSFFRRDARKFNSYFDLLSDLEKKYYVLFIQFIGREYLKTKIGEHGVFASNGLASLWLDNMQMKAEGYRILSHLSISGNRASDDNPVLELCFTAQSNTLSRFRRGDIAVLYPESGTERAVLSNQLLKCTIIEIDDEKVILRLRARQKNEEWFARYQFWNLEADNLDSSFNKQYQSLYDFISSPLTYRRKLLCLEAPQKVEAQTRYRNTRMTSHQELVVNKAIAAEDYFLLWGPPGTGKTSVMIHGLVDYYYNSTNADIILMAYTNRAVDEICASIEEIEGIDYLRIGSRYSTASEYSGRLLGFHIEHTDNRDALRSLIQSCRIFVCTVSSFHSQRDMLDMKQFDVAVIDEASQILEPMLAGMLGHSGKFILIGDHKQLPAVVTQSSSQSKVMDDELTEKTGLFDLANSLFERLFVTSVKKGWSWAFDILDQQGRMHEDILGFVSPQFYNGKLQLLPGIDRLTSKARYKAFDSLSTKLIHSRMLFVDAPIDEEITRKTNTVEAQLVSTVSRLWDRIYAFNGLAADKESIGVISPFRSQVALIKSHLDLWSEGQITVDTVERYQGGSRNQILISLAVSKAQLLDSIGNISEEGIDRKLNVALTRAKENVVIFGCRKVLEASPVYRALIGYCAILAVEEIQNYSFE